MVDVIFIHGIRPSISVSYMFSNNVGSFLAIFVQLLEQKAVGILQKKYLRIFQSIFLPIEGQYLRNEKYVFNIFDARIIGYQWMFKEAK